MAINTEMLNHQEREARIRPGVYMNDNRNTCVVVRVKEGKATFLTPVSGTVVIGVEFLSTFARNWPVSLPNYPVRRALRKFNDGRTPVEASAASVIRTILG